MKGPPSGLMTGHRSSIAVRIAALWLAACLAPAPAAAAPGVTFSHDVMAVLSKAGCNQGVCHGNRSGKGGFKLSLRGQDPAADFDTLTAELLGRRVDRIDPASSLVLLKPTGVVPHEGGVRFERGSADYAMLREWIERGCPPDPSSLPRLERIATSVEEVVLDADESDVRVSVEAFFSDGSRRDVTSLAVFEPVERLAQVVDAGRIRLEGPGEATVIVRYLDRQRPVRLTRVPAREGFAWEDVEERTFIDTAIFRKLRTLRIQPSDVCGDGEFIRRATLDLLGILPTADEVREFLADRRPDRRELLVERLLERPEFAEFWALKWADLLRVEEKTLDRKGVQIFHRWLTQAIATGLPLNELARRLVAARGSTYINPPANFYRASREPIERAEGVAQVFLGIRLGCARCHNHPFDRWTQDDYYSWANLFARVRYKVLENRRRDRNDKHEFVGEQVVFMADRGDVPDPRTGAPRPPRMLGAAVDSGDSASGHGATAGRAGDTDAGDDRLERLADWIADPDNPFFARAQANRIWMHLMGRGLVEPVDDFRLTNPPSHPELIERLAGELVASGFDLRRMIRIIMKSRAYQLSSVPNDTNADDEVNYSRTIIRRLTAEQLLDAMSSVTGAPVRFNGYPVGTRAGQLAGVRAIRARDASPSPGDHFLTLFGKPPRLAACECERSVETTMSQAFQLISGPLVDELLTRPGNRLDRLLESGKTSRRIVEDLFLSALARPPAEVELERTVAALDSSGNRRAALEDIVWSLLNAKEFVFRH